MPEINTVNSANSINPSEIAAQEMPETQTTNQIVDLVQSELLDIEYPLDPGVDWLGLTQSFIVGLLVVLIVAGLVYLLWRSKSANNGLLMGVFKLKWQFKTLAPGLVTVSTADNATEKVVAMNVGKNIDKTVLMNFYLWMKQFEHCLQHLQVFKVLTLVEDQQALVRFAELKYRSQAMAFSQHQVPREAYEQVLVQAQSLLKQLLTAKVIIAYIRAHIRAYIRAHLKTNLKAKITDRGQS